MPKLKNYGPGRRINIWVPERQLALADDIDNLSNFFQICLDNAADIMAWAILKGYDPKKFNTGKQVADVLDEFNQRYPQNELTAKRTGKNGPGTIGRNETASQEQNPALL